MASSKHYAIFRFYADLNDFLSHERWSADFVVNFGLHPSVEDMIESLGAPHPEIDMVLVNGTPVDFAYAVQDRDRISVYPAFTSIDVSSLLRLRQPLPEFRFVLDTHLGRLATYLRLLGFDSVYDNCAGDRELAQLCHDEDRILLTRDTGLLKRREVVYGYFVRATDPVQQAIEIVRRFALVTAAVPFHRCLRCNSVLRPASKDSVFERLHQKTREHFEEFRTCPCCKRIYWQGSHFDHMQRLVQRIVREHIG